MHTFQLLYLHGNLLTAMQNWFTLLVSKLAKKPSFSTFDTEAITLSGHHSQNRNKTPESAVLLFQIYLSNY